MFTYLFVLCDLLILFWGQIKSPLGWMQRKVVMKLLNGVNLLPWLLKESHEFCGDLIVLYNLYKESQDRIRKKLQVFLNEKHIVFSNLLKVVNQSCPSKLIHQFDFKTILSVRMNCLMKLDSISLIVIAMPVSWPGLILGF